MKTEVLAEPVLVGRERELAELMRNLDLAFEGKGTTVFVSGEAGAGKTRLVHEFLETAKKKGFTLLAGWCLSDAAVPYFPFVQAFDAYFSPIHEEEFTDNQQFGTPTMLGIGPVGIERPGITAWLTRLIPDERTGERGALSPQVWKDQLFAAVAQTLHSISAQSPTILFIEDIHWADSASLSLLHYISRIISSEKILILATFRSEELTANAEGYAHPLTEAMRLMRREDILKEIKLSNLDQNSVSRIAENMIGGRVHPELVEKLTRESRGNPLFVVESLRMLSERKNLVQENDKWRLTVDSLGIPEKLKDIILRRLSSLKFAQRRVLDAASVIGEKFNLELLGAVLDQDSLEVLETLNIIAQSTSLVCVEENSYRFNHEKSRQAIYEEIPSPLRRGYHAKIADNLEKTNQQNKTPFSDIAYHYSQAGNGEKATKYALAAGQDALARWSNQEAIKHFTYVVQNISETAENAESKRIAQEGLGDAYYANCMYEEAATIFESIANSETGKLRLRAYRKTMDAVYFKRGEGDRLMELVKRAEQYAGLDRLESARILWNKARAELHSAPKASLQDHEEALRVLEEEYSLPDVAELLCGTGFALLNLGFHEKALNPILRSIALFQELKSSEREITATLIAGQAFVFCGLFEESSRAWSNVFKIGEKIGHYAFMSQASHALGTGLEHQGIFRDAVSQNLKALEYSLKTDNKTGAHVSHVSLCRQYARLGDLEHASEYFTKLLGLPPRTLEHHWVSFEAALSEAVFFAAKSQWKDANQHFEKAFKRLKLIGHPKGWEVNLRTHYAWALGRQGRVLEEKVQLEEIQKIHGEVEKRFQHVDIDAVVMAPRKVFTSEEFEMQLDLVNVSRKSGLIAKVKGLVLPELAVSSPPVNCRLENDFVEMQNRSIGPFQVETLKLRLKASKPGIFTLNPQVTYIDELGETKTCEPTTITITVQPAQPKYEVLSGRITTGYAELDELLLGGIPQNYAVALTSPSTDEKELLVKRFLEAGATAGETTFYVTAEAGHAKALADKYPSNFYLFLCNLQADAMIQSAPNVFKLKGLENLTDIDIALTKAFRTIDPSTKGAKRICLEIVSDVLLQHHAISTRRWLSALLPTLKSKGFTILAGLDPQMHPPEETQATVGLFEGEITIHEKETPKGTERFLKIRRLSNQKYLKDEIRLTEE